jgi:hypothetical protein
LLVTTLALMALTTLSLLVKKSPITVSANTGVILPTGCGVANVNGVVNPAEWIGAAIQDITLTSTSSGAHLTATLSIMNSATDLYMGITISDADFITQAEYLPMGDSFRIDFDNDHNGTRYTAGDDVLIVGAGEPHFGDAFIYTTTYSTAKYDTVNAGTLDGTGAASRVTDLNHFELVHPLCSGDIYDFCLHAGITVGFQLEYMNARAGQMFVSYRYPGPPWEDMSDIVIGPCQIIYLPLIRK